VRGRVTLESYGRPIPEAYAPATLERLRAIKAVYDPHNRFRVNHNVPPTTKG
jgi:FAD/FMN-containing dehydrogenase